MQEHVGDELCYVELLGTYNVQPHPLYKSVIARSGVGAYGKGGKPQENIDYEQVLGNRGY